MDTLEQVRAKIRKNFPKERTALRWKKVTEHRIVSHCDRFVIDRHGEGDATRYTAKRKPDTVIGHRLLTSDKAKEICEQHASPLPLEPKR